MKKLFLSIIALLTLSVEMWAQAQSVNYIDENGVAQTATATEVHNSTTTLNAGWYVVTGTDVRTGSLTCKGEVHLILADGAKLTATGGYYQAGIQVSGEGNSLTIYGQAAQSGRLIATGGEHGSGIGGGDSGSGSNITINGGMVTATGGEYGSGIGGGDSGSGSNITINGGTVVATGGGSAAGIGGGWQGSGSYITINGGMVTANGGEYGSGIGGGFDGSGSYITINSGTVTATGGGSAAGIGGGEYAFGSNITINGGTVTATGGGTAAGIGGGFNGSGSNITIIGGTVTAIGGESAAGIGGGSLGDGSDITINGGTVTATGGIGGVGIGGGESGSGSDITVEITLILKADNNNPPTTLIENNGNDLANKLSGKQYATIVNLISYKKAATDAIDAAIEGVTDEDVLDIATTAKTNINSATTSATTTTVEAIDSIKTQALSDILAKAKEKAVAAIDAKIEGVTDTDILAIAEAAKTSISSATTAGDVESIKNTALADLENALKYYNSGKTAGKAELVGAMGTECTGCPAVKVKKGDKTIILYTPEEVEFMIIQSEE